MDGWNPAHPPRPFFYGLEEGGFAHPTVIKRWPVIVTDCINTVLRHSTPKNTAQAGKVVAMLSALKYELDRLRPFTFAEPTAFISDQDPSTSTNTNDHETAAANWALYWKKAIADHFPTHSFLTASWLFAECLLYARIHAAFLSQSLWADFDVFLDDKKKGLRDLKDKIVRITESHEHLISTVSSDTPSETFRPHLRDLLLLSLWGNATDLSMFAGLSASEIEQMRSGASGQENIISNHIPEILNYISESGRFDPSSTTSDIPRRIDFILDNSGFELFSDLLLADYLHQTGRVQETVFHCKTIPWFVSDTMPSDFEWLLTALEDPSNFFTTSESLNPTPMKSLAARYRGYISSGAWKITSDPVWCTFWAHHHLKMEAPALFMDIKENSLLVIFKGDLNYRKLVYDCKWDVTTPFEKVLGSVGEWPAAVSLRTNKSDPIVGIPEGVEERLLAEGFSDWRWSGKLAVVEFHANV
ncbi:hypothetical protein BJ741DRAFT_647152 [Chytriomyces cf. hyalinus JEL632]|nr:hypothetical protein BJ741DRAFT_647152 [Chytriomyces cf. hyalinus JEL632]